MKLCFPLILLAMSALLAWSCSNLTDAGANATSVTPAHTFKGDVSDPCFDAQLEAWMQSFQQYQHTGMDMFAADEKARVVANAVYQECKHRATSTIANGQARKE